jgi:hypothetical protein
MPQWLSDPAAPAWVQAVGSVIAILVAVFIPWFQRRNTLRDAAKERARQEKDHLQRLSIGLREEIRAANDAASRRQLAITMTLEQIARAESAGAAVKESDPVQPGSLSLTDAIVYKQIAAELGLLPPGLIKAIVAFYSLTLELGRVANSAPTAMQAYRDIFASLPRVRTHAAIVVRTLEKFEEAGFRADADLRLRPEEIRRFAADAGYPLDEIAKERGVQLPS